MNNRKPDSFARIRRTMAVFSRLVAVLLLGVSLLAGSTRAMSAHVQVETVTVDGVWIEICSGDGAKLILLENGEIPAPVDCEDCPYCVVVNHNISPLPGPGQFIDPGFAFESIRFAIVDVVQATGIPTHRTFCRGPPNENVQSTMNTLCPRFGTDAMMPCNLPEAS
jgi:hypothetical protein